MAQVRARGGQAWVRELIREAQKSESSQKMIELLTASEASLYAELVAAMKDGRDAEGVERARANWRTALRNLHEAQAAGL